MLVILVATKYIYGTSASDTRSASVALLVLNPSCFDTCDYDVATVTSAVYAQFLIAL